MARSSLAGVNYTFVTLHSKKASDSTQTGAVLDVNKGLVDVSATNFFMTSERASLTGFTTSLFVDSFYLWSARPREDSSIRAQFDKVFRPFTWSFWLTFGACMAGVGLLRPWLDQGDSRGGSRWRGKRGVVAMHALHATFMDLTSGGLQPDQWTPAKGTASMILAVGWGLMVIFTLAVYRKPRSVSHEHRHRRLVRDLMSLCAPMRSTDMSASAWQVVLYLEGD